MSVCGVGGLRVFLDGALADSGVWFGPTLRFTAMKIGTNRGQSQRYNGTIDDVLVWPREITGAEISQIFTSRSAGVCP